mmetsp:Transcript_30114/g.22374  ORF Transcript_30114/g.22374 Transcript_30114/m.22374 type:complete len:113 (+) Transcript_30114:53-391(+)
MTISTTYSHALTDRKSSFFQHYNVHGQDGDQGFFKEELNLGGIKEMATFGIFSSSMKEVTCQRLQESYGEDLHPKLLELALLTINEVYPTSNQRCIATLLALKHYIHDFQVP